MKYLVLCLLLSGCASRAVHCDAHLQPINAPAAKAAGAGADAP